MDTLLRGANLCSCHSPSEAAPFSRGSRGRRAAKAGQQQDPVQCPECHTQRAGPAPSSASALCKPSLSHCSPPAPPASGLLALQTRLSLSPQGLLHCPRRAICAATGSSCSEGALSQTAAESCTNPGETKARTPSDKGIFA